MNRRDFLGLLGKGAIALTIPLSADVLASIPDVYSPIKVKAIFCDFDCSIGVGVSCHKNGQLCRHGILIDSYEDWPIRKLTEEFNNWLGFNGVSEKQINDALSGLVRSV